MRKALAGVVLAGLAFAGCGLTGPGGTFDVTASFDDVGDLAPSAPVMMADVQIGKVAGIDLEDGRALVTMRIDRSAGVPEGAIARVRRTSLLGERIIDLEVPPDLPDTASLLHDGDRIRRTVSRPDLEDLVQEGTDVLAPIAASEIATLVDEGARGFGESGEELGTLLQNFQVIVRGYAGRTGEIRSVIRSLNQLNATLAPEAEAHAASVANTARALDVLREESGRLRAAIRSLSRLSVGARSMLEEHSDEMARFFRQMRTILGVLREEERSIVQLLRWAPEHNRNTQTTEYRDFVQVYQDFVICGLNDDPDDPARNCEGGSR